MKEILILMGVYILSVNSTCKSKISCNQTTYFFSSNFVAYPDLDSILVNDTIWLELSCSTQLVDQSTGNLIDYSGAKNFGTDINFYELIGGSISNPGGIAAANAFDYKLVKGVFIPDSHLPDQNRDYIFIEEDGHYKFKLGVIPKRTGIFTLSPGDAVNVYRQSDQCTKAGVSFVFANTNQHLYLYEQNRPGYIPSNYEKTHMYCFKVK